MTNKKREEIAELISDDMIIVSKKGFYTSGKSGDVARFLVQAANDDDDVMDIIAEWEAIMNLTDYNEQ